jgi:hypothetical protein
MSSETWLLRRNQIQVETFSRKLRLVFGATHMSR